MDETLICQFVGETNQMYASLLLFETDRSLGCEDSGGSLFACATAGCSICVTWLMCGRCWTT
jgi:hypothetical protein